MHRSVRSVPSLLCLGLFALVTSCYRGDGATTTHRVQETETIVIPGTEIEHDDALLHHDVTALFYDGKPFSGTVVEHDDSGGVVTKTSYYEGLKHGPHLGYYPDGSPMFERPYYRGEKHGVHRAWHLNGELKFDFYFQHGLSEGNHRQWYEDGTLYSNMNYLHGRESGSQKVYRPDGKLRANYVVRENGRKYGLVGLKRCKNLDTEKETFNVLKASE